MKKKTVTKATAKKERDPKKKVGVLKLKWISSGKLPKGKEMYHIKPVVEGGKTTPNRDINRNVVMRTINIQQVPTKTAIRFFTSYEAYLLH